MQLVYRWPSSEIVRNMRNLLPTLVALVSAVSCHSRLIRGNLTNTLNETEVSLPTRMTRAALDEEITSFSKEEYQSGETAQSTTTRRLKMSFRPKYHSRQKTNLARIPRDYAESTLNKTENDRSQKTKAPLIKKPIPKFNEIDYEDDFQVKVIRSPVAFADSGDHEDDDFNLDDYDFDVNHDEYAGRGKPLEPRVKNKNLLEQQNLFHSESESEQTVKPVPLPVIKVKSKVVIPSGEKSIKKRDDKLKNTKKTAQKFKEDYYDDLNSLAKTQIPEQVNKVREIEAEIVDDNDDSKEFDRKSTRLARSPWSPNAYIDKLGEKTSVILSKVMSALPMFPQVPRRVEESYSDWLMKNYNEVAIDHPLY